jgi:hypothetical protein
VFQVPILLVSNHRAHRVLLEAIVLSLMLRLSPPAHRDHSLTPLRHHVRHARLGGNVQTVMALEIHSARVGTMHLLMHQSVKNVLPAKLVQAPHLLLSWIVNQELTQLGSRLRVLLVRRDINVRMSKLPPAHCAEMAHTALVARLPVQHVLPVMHVQVNMLI